MNLKRCSNKHFYDADKFDTCPYCQGREKDMGTVQVGFPEIHTNDPVGEIPTGNRPAPTPYDGNSYPTENGGSETGWGNVHNPWSGKEEGATVWFSSGGFEKEPVVGWLVCVKGVNYGKSYIIKCGRNFVGRGKDMDVQIVGDESISRDRHAILLYEPKRREFIAQPGESKGLYYVNDEVVLAPRKLQRYDILSLGQTNLMFFPCCDEVFSWEDYAQTGKKEEK